MTTRDCFNHVFIYYISRAKGKEGRRCPCYERQRAKLDEMKASHTLFISTEINVYSHKSQHGGMNFSSRALIRAEGRAFGVLSVNKKPKSTGTTRQHSSPALPD